jgi:hypothetical protein
MMDTYIVIILVSLLATASCECIHEEIMATVTPLGAPQKYTSLKRTTTESIRIYIDSSRLDRVGFTDSDYTWFAQLEFLLMTIFQLSRRRYCNYVKWNYYDLRY